jgi:hypothetical protein
MARPHPRRVPRALQPLVGSVVLVAAVRAIDLLWTRTTGSPPPQRSADTPADDDTAPRVVRDRLVYALLLGGALRLAQRVGLREGRDPEAAPDA